MATPARRNPWTVPSLFHGDWPDLLQSFSAGLEESPGIRLEELIDGGDLIIRAEIPGIDPERDVDITVQQGSLRIRAQRRAEARSEEKGYFRTEFQYGSFTRVVPLPAGADESDVSAHYHDGILEIRVPLESERASARRVPVARREAPPGGAGR